MASFYVSVKKSGQWRVIEQSYKEGKSFQKTVPKITYEAFGINPSWTSVEAKQRISELNKQNKIQRKEKTKISAIASRVVEIKNIKSAFLPTDLVEEFTDKLRKKNFGSEIHQKKILSHWKYICKMIADLKIKPVNYFENADAFYRYFIGRNNSPDYSKNR
jgi:hypothetical protein